MKPDEQRLRKFFKNFLNPFMIFMWRLGLGRFINAAPEYGGQLMVLTHLGRKSGRRRRTPVNYAVVDNEIYCTAGFGSLSDWYRNILVNPNVEVWLPEGWWAGVAEEVSDETRRLPLLRQVLIGSGFAASTFGGIHPSKISDEELAQVAQPYRLIHIKRQAARTGDNGPGDLSWIWMVTTIILFFLWRRQKTRKKKR